MSRRRRPRHSKTSEPRGLSRRFLSEVGPYWGSLLLIFAVDLLATPLMLLAPVPLKIAVDNVLGDQPLSSYVDVLLPDALSSGTGLLLAAAILQVLVVGLAQLQQLGSYVLRVRTGEVMTQALRERLFAHAQRLSLRRHDSRGSSDSVYRIQYDAQEVQKVTVDGLLTTAASAITLAATVIVVARLDWQLAVVGLLVSPLLVHLTRRYRLRVRPRYRDVKGIETNAMQVIQEAMGALRW